LHAGLAPPPKLCRPTMRVISTDPNPDVLIVTNMWPHSRRPNYGIFVSRQIESLKPLGLPCSVLFIEGYRTRWDYARAAFHIFRLNWSKRRPRLIHGHGGETGLVVRWFVRGPVVVSYCGDDLLGTPRADGSMAYAHRVRRVILRQQARLLTATITKSAEMEATLPRSARDRNTVIPNGVDRSLFRPQPRHDARLELGWASTERIVVFASDPAVDRKRYWLAEAACREAQRRIGPIRLVVASDVSPDRMPRLMVAADCLLLTSVHEGSPNVVKEAVACGLPVVSTDVGDVRQMLHAVEPSWVCLPDPADLAAALVECLAERRRSNGWERSTWLGQEQIAVRLLELYRRLAPDVSSTEVRPDLRARAHFHPDSADLDPVP
jgi:teichuronic acid biosynthesis glycosyltransferase TuaC